jgi:hypothetical protein
MVTGLRLACPICQDFPRVLQATKAKVVHIITSDQAQLPGALQPVASQDYGALPTTEQWGGERAEAITAHTTAQRGASPPPQGVVQQRFSPPPPEAHVHVTQQPRRQGPSVENQMDLLGDYTAEVRAALIPWSTMFIYTYSRLYHENMCEPSRLPRVSACVCLCGPAVLRILC